MCQQSPIIWQGKIHFFFGYKIIYEENNDDTHTSYSAADSKTPNTRPEVSQHQQNVIIYRERDDIIYILVTFHAIVLHYIT